MRYVCVDAEMKSKVIVLSLTAFVLMSTAAAIFSHVSANFSPVLPPDNIVIQADGRVTGTEKIVRKGDIYTFTANISGTKIIQGTSTSNMSSALAVQRSNIVIEGAGFTLECNGGTGIDISNGVCSKPSEREIWNVTVKNLRITNSSCGIRCDFGGNHIIFGDYISNDFITGGEKDNFSWASLGIALWGSSGNNISRCTIGGSPAVYMHFCCSGNIVTENNIVYGVHLAISGNETFDRNYWSDYSARYPKTTEINSSGVWNLPYAFEDSQFQKSGFQDNHPLVNPMSIPTFSTVLPTVLPPRDQGSFPIVFVAALVAIVTAAVAGAVILSYRKKHRH